MADPIAESADTQVRTGAGNGLAPGAATLRFLGAAFLVQAIGSAVSGLVLAPVDLLANSAPADMATAVTTKVDCRPTAISANPIYRTIEA